MHKDDLFIGAGIAFLVVVLAICWMSLVGKADSERSKIEYCFDGQGNHYIAPNNNCTH